MIDSIRYGALPGWMSDRGAALARSLACFAVFFRRNGALSVRFEPQPVLLLHACFQFCYARKKHPILFVEGLHFLLGLNPIVPIPIAISIYIAQKHGCPGRGYPQVWTRMSVAALKPPWRFFIASHNRPD